VSRTFSDVTEAGVTAAYRRYILRYVWREMRGRSWTQRLTLLGGGGFVLAYGVARLVVFARQQHAALVHVPAWGWLFLSAINVVVAAGYTRRVVSAARAVAAQGWVLVLPLDVLALRRCAERDAAHIAALIGLIFFTVEVLVAGASRIPDPWGVLALSAFGLSAGTVMGALSVRRRRPRWLTGEDRATIATGEAPLIGAFSSFGFLRNRRWRVALPLLVLGELLTELSLRARVDGGDVTPSVGGIGLIAAHLMFIAGLRTAPVFQAAIRVLPLSFYRALWREARSPMIASLQVFAASVLMALVLGLSVSRELCGYCATAMVLNCGYLCLSAGYSGNDRLARISYAAMIGIGLYNWALMGPLILGAGLVIAVVAYRRGRSRFLMGDWT